MKYALLLKLWDLVGPVLLEALGARVRKKLEKKKEEKENRNALPAK